MKLSQSDIAREKRYREEERLGIMCGANTPTAEEYATAKREADEWEAKHLGIPTKATAAPACCSACHGRGEVLDADPYADRRGYVTCKKCNGSGNQ